MVKAAMGVDQESSLNAIWRAYGASVCDRHAVPENRTTVVHAFLQARYYDGSKGEFLSEDPVFLADPKS